MEVGKLRSDALFCSQAECAILIVCVCVNDCVLKTLGERLGSKGKSPFLGSEPLTSQSTVTVHYHSAN